MNRRSFLTSSLRLGAHAGVAAIAGAQTSEKTVEPRAADHSLPERLIGTYAEDDYFTEKRLYESLGTDQLLKPEDVQVIVYNFPSWHTSPFMEKHFGKGWTEFETVRNARKLFDGHSMPHYPLWGYYDEADPVWAAREVDLAVGHGVDAWMIDWYWHQGTQFYHEQLERGFLKAANRDKLKFALMWANHDWNNVYPARSPFDAGLLLPQVHTSADFGDVINYCAERYFSQPNYLTVEQAPVFAIFDPGKIIAQLGEDGLKRAIELMRERARALGFPKLHIQVNNSYDGLESKLGSFGVDSATMYGTFAWSYGVKPPGSRIGYGVGAAEGIRQWEEKRRKLKVPFFPCCSVGWDDSPRFGEYSAIAINRSPDQFERVVRAARHFLGQDTKNKLIYVSAWNEWTEDHVLLPDTYWGYSYLEALRRAVRD